MSDLLEFKPLKIFLCGATGRMGHEIYDLSRTREGFEVTGGFADIPGDLPFPVYTSLDDIESPDFDVIVDFTSAAALPTPLESPPAHIDPVPRHRHMDRGLNIAKCRAFLKNRKVMSD